MLTQVRGRYLTGALLERGATLLAIAGAIWPLDHMKRFFQVTSIFLLLFILQIALYSFHEFAEAGVFGARSDSWHAATEVWSPEGMYGKWISLAIVAVSSFWLLAALVGDRLRRLEPMATPVPK